MKTRTKRRLLGLTLAACVLTTWALDDPKMYDPQPGPNAPAYVNWRTGEVVQP